jgi:hypothetical protein
LCRPLFAEFLEESAARLGDARLGGLAKRYGELGAGWSALAEAALPDGVPAFRESKELLTRKSELYHSEGASTWEGGACGTELGALGTQMKECFPLNEAQSAALRKELKKRVESLYAGEKAAAAELGAWLTA